MSRSFAKHPRQDSRETYQLRGVTFSPFSPVFALRNRPYLLHNSCPYKDRNINCPIRNFGTVSHQTDITTFDKGPSLSSGLMAVVGQPSTEDHVDLAGQNVFGPLSSADCLVIRQYSLETRLFLSSGFYLEISTFFCQAILLRSTNTFSSRKPLPV